MVIPSGSSYAIFAEFCKVTKGFSFFFAEGWSKSRWLPTPYRDKNNLNNPILKFFTHVQKKENELQHNHEDIFSVWLLPITRIT
jgi:hypothetical protein